MHSKLAGVPGLVLEGCELLPESLKICDVCVQGHEIDEDDAGLQLDDPRLDVGELGLPLRFRDLRLLHDRVTIALRPLELIERGGWLRTYRGHERGDDPFADPGSWDITVDIGFDQLPPKSRLVPQAEWLGDWGIDELVAEGRAYWDAHAAAPDLAAMRMRSRVNEAAALTDPAGLGGWWVAEWWRRRRSRSA